MTFSFYIYLARFDDAMEMIIIIAKVTTKMCSTEELFFNCGKKPWKITVSVKLLAESLQLYIKRAHSQLFPRFLTTIAEQLHCRTMSSRIHIIAEYFPMIASATIQFKIWNSSFKIFFFYLYKTKCQSFAFWGGEWATNKNLGEGLPRKGKWEF